MSEPLAEAEPALRAVRRPAPPVPVRRHHPARRGQPQRVRGDPPLRRRERRPRAPRRQPARGEPAPGDLPAERRDGRPRPARRRRARPRPPSRLRGDPDQRDRGAERPRARQLAGRGDRRRRRRLPREADREPARLPGVRARRAARRREPPRPEERDVALDGRASVRAALEEDLRRARALLAEALPAGDAETVAYCAQFVGSVGEMLGDRDLAAAARRASQPAGGALLAAALTARIEARGVARVAAGRVDLASARSHADRAVEADDAAVQHRVLRDLEDEGPELVRLAEPGGEGDLPAEALPRPRRAGPRASASGRGPARSRRPAPRPAPDRGAIGRVIDATAPLEAA